MTSRMKIQPWALLVLVAVAVRAEAPPPSQETPIDRCVKKSSGDIMKYICYDGEYHISFGAISHVSITCQDTKLNCSRFPSIDFGRNSTSIRLQVTRCALDEPISCFLAKLNIADVQRLALYHFLTPLTARHFKGMRATTNFRIYETDYPSVQKTIPYETIASLPHLKRVEIIGAQLTLAPQVPLLKELYLSSNSISVVPPGFFKGLPSLDELTLWNNSIVDINNDTFAGLGKLRWLNLGHNRISELRGGVLSPLRRLETLYIRHNPLTRLHDGFLQGLDQLQKITISSSEPLDLGLRAFADLRSLLYLIVENSLIQELNGTVFQGSKLIHTVRLRNNQLERLHPEVFWDQTEMTRLDLSKNRLANITGDVFKTLVKLENLDLSFNQLEYFPEDMFWHLENLKSLSASHNKLRQISTYEFGLSPFEFVDLSYNLIDDIGNVFMGDASPLRSLNLTHNRISKLTPAIFYLTGDVTSLYYVSTVDLSYNNISTVDLGLEFCRLQKPLANFILDHNPLNCDCHIHSFVKLATSYNYSQYFSLLSAQCNYPDRLQGTGLTQVPLDEFKCQVKCPSVCNCTNVPNKGIVEAVCSGDSTDPSRITGNVSLKFIRKPKTLRHRSFENVVKIDLSGLQLNEIDFETLPETVKVLKLSNNNLNYLPNEVLNKNISFVLGNNPLSCDCWNKENVAKLQQNSAKFIDYPALKCKCGKLLSQVDIQQICDVWKVTIVGVSLTGLSVLCLLFTVIIYRYSFEVKIYISKYFPYLLPEEKYDASKKFDVFISYAHQDEDFVRDTLLPKLEGPPINVKTCIHSRDWLVGEMIPYNIAKSVEESRRTLIVLSENFLKSIWGLLEFRTAHVQATKEGRARVVVVLLEDVMNKEDLNKEIKAYLRTNTYIKWGEPWFWEKLAYALPKRSKVVDSREKKRLQSIANELAQTGLEMQQNNED